MPLLDPICAGGCSRGVPFVTGIELHGIDSQALSRSWADSSSTREALGLDNDGNGFFELRFVLHGLGVMQSGLPTSRMSHAESVEIRPGDAVLCTSGSAVFEMADPQGAAKGSVSDGMIDREVPWGMTTFVVYIPKALVVQNPCVDDVFDECARFFRERIWTDMSCDGKNISQVLAPDVPDVLNILLCGPKMVETSLAVSDIIPSDDDDDDDGAGGAYDIGPRDLVPATTVRSHSGPSTSVTGQVPTIQDGDDLVSALKMTLSDVSTFMLPNQTNRLALMFDPFANSPIPFVFGVEIFEPGHKTTPHVHTGAYEVFFILSGQGYGFCDTERFPVGPGDVVAFHPGSTHGIDNGSEQRMYCIEVMLPDEDFAEFVRQGRIDSLGNDDLCILTRIGCS